VLTSAAAGDIDLIPSLCRKILRYSFMCGATAVQSSVVKRRGRLWPNVFLDASREICDGFCRAR